MARNEYERDRERGSPNNLVAFTYGDGMVHRYTDHEENIVYDGETYTAVPLSVTQVKSDGKLNQGQVDFMMPKSTLIAELFRVYPPTQVVSVVLREGHIANAGDPSGHTTGEQYPVSWVGRVVDTERRPDGSIKLVGQSAAGAVSRPGLRRHFQRPCPYVLFGTGCGATKGLASYAATVDTVGLVSANRITLNPGWFAASGADAYTDFVRGTIEWTSSLGTETRAIVRMTDEDTLFVSAPIRGLIANQAVTMILRCQRTVDDCRRLHDNIVNYGGQAYVPRFNPIGVNNHTA